MSGGAVAQSTTPEGAPVSAELPSIPETIPDATVFEGKPVIAVRAKMQGLLWTKPPTLLAPKVGAKFAVQEARAELMRLLSGGGFASGTLDVNPVNGGVEVVYRLVPARFVRRVVLKGNVLGDDEVRRAAGLGDVRDVTEKSMDVAGQKVRAYYVRRGFPAARVELSTIETDAPLVVVVQVRIDAGLPLLVRSRVFSGLPTWDAVAVASAQKYSVQPGDRADEEALELADRALSNALRAGGFPSATVTHSFSPVEEGGVVLTVNVVPGPKVIPTFEGHLAFDREQLLDILDLKGEADRSPLRLASKIEAAYRKRGYYDAHVEPEMLGAPTDAQRTLRFRIREGDLVTVAKRVYPCLTGALSAKRIEEEIDSFLDEEVSGEGFGDAPHTVIDKTISSAGDVAKGARPIPDVPPGRSIFVPETYDRAVEHLRELFKSEGYMFAELGDVGVLRGACAKGSLPGAANCKAKPPPALDEKKLCALDQNQLPLPIPPLEKKLACVSDPLKGIECAPTLVVVVPINPGPRSYLWDVTFEGTHAVAPAVLGSTKIAGQHLRMGEPLSLRDAENARKAVIEHYRDEGFVFATVRVNFEYSSDKSRARIRFVITEGEQVVIDKIFVEGEKRTLESLIRDRLLIKEGGIYRMRLVRESQDRLIKLNVFQSVAIALVNPGVPAKRKSVVVSVVERPNQHFDYRAGYATGEGFRFFGEYGYANLFGYAVSFDARVRFSYQPFLGSTCDSPDQCTGGGLYDSTVIRRWRHQTTGLQRYPRRISLGFTLPHTPIFGSPVKATFEIVNVLDLRRDFVLDKYSPILTLTYQPWQPLTLVFHGDLEYNSFRIFDDQALDRVIASNPGLQTLLRVPRGDTGVAATGASVLFDFRDSRLGATKGWYASLATEYVRSVLTPPSGEKRQDFLHFTSGIGLYTQLGFLPKKPVLAFELRGGLNVNNPLADCVMGGVELCDTYPDRLFYIGGVETNRGFFAGQMLPQDSIDQLSTDPGANLSSVSCAEYPRDPATGETLNVNVGGGAVITGGGSCGSDLAAIAPRGGNVFINPRAEVRVGAFKWGGFVFFVDASNTWRDKSKFNPLRLRYSIGPGLSIDTPVGPVALDLGFNLSRFAAFGEPLPVFNFSIGRF